MSIILMNISKDSVEKNVKDLITLKKNEIFELMESYQLMTLDIFSLENNPTFKDYSDYGLDSINIIVGATNGCSPAALLLFEKALGPLLHSHRYAVFSYQSLIDTLSCKTEDMSPEEVSEIFTKILNTKETILDISENDNNFSFKI